jgi:hypothetical protein
MGIANKAIVGIAVVGGFLISWSLFLFATFFSGGGNQGQYWNWGWTLFIPGSASWVLAAVLYRSHGRD